MNKKIIALIYDDFEDLELWYPILRLREAGVKVDVVGPNKQKEFTGKYGVPAESDYTFGEVSYKEYDGILIPGGWAPDKLRRFPKVLEIVSYMDKEKLMIGQICHAGWVSISADILDEVNVTSTPGIKDDMENAGAIWHDKPCVVDGHIISSRRPPDLPEYLKEILNFLDN
ncbi:MAG: type 1 glutamine amidotransferase domain-containing protein [Bacillota bacterium]